MHSLDFTAEIVLPCNLDHRWPHILLIRTCPFCL